jgi:hypothetical protein
MVTFLNATCLATPALQQEIQVHAEQKNIDFR